MWQPCLICQTRTEHLSKTGYRNSIPRGTIWLSEIWYPRRYHFGTFEAKGYCLHTNKGTICSNSTAGVLFRYPFFRVWRLHRAFARCQLTFSVTTHSTLATKPTSRSVIMIYFYVLVSPPKPTSDGRFAFGTYKPATPGNFGKATVDQFMIWNRDLNDADITALYNDQV